MGDIFIFYNFNGLLEFTPQKVAQNQFRGLIPESFMAINFLHSEDKKEIVVLYHKISIYSLFSRNKIVLKSSLKRHIVKYPL